MNHKRRKVGLAPGTLVFTGKRKIDEVNIHYVEYNVEKFHAEIKNNTQVKSLYEPVDELIQWYDVRGLHDTELISKLGGVFNIHPLALEEIGDVHQRPKYEEYAEGIFIALNALYISDGELKKEYVSIYFGKGFVLSFQEEDTDLFRTVRERLQLKKGRVRGREADYLAYSLLDNIVDSYFLLTDHYSELIDKMEDDIILDPKESSKAMIHNLKSESLKVRRNIYPLREAISRFSKSDHVLIDDQNLPFIRDAYENIVHVMDLIENNRDLIYSLHDLYTSEISLRMNKVMHLLTIVTTIFVPLSFLVGVYGMNFEYIPELGYKWGYFILWGFMIFISLLSLIIFRKNKWI